MQRRIRLTLNGVRALRELRAGISQNAVCNATGLTHSKIMRIESTFDGIPDSVLGIIERLLNDRERLKKVISNLVNTGLGA
jgi:hypothetical protein